jgi:hypothetical protein
MEGEWGLRNKLCTSEISPILVVGLERTTKWGKGTRTTYPGVISVLGILPKPLPDELLYSLLARMRAQLGTRPHTWRKVLLGRKVTVLIDLPGHIEKLVSQFPPGNTLTADELIDRHTLLPFHAVFLDPDRVRQVRDAMIFSMFSRSLI